MFLNLIRRKVRVQANGKKVEIKKIKKIKNWKKTKFYLRQHSVLDWSPTSILSGPCDACLRGSDETRKVHRGMAADGEKWINGVLIPHFFFFLKIENSGSSLTFFTFIITESVSNE